MYHYYSVLKGDPIRSDLDTDVKLAIADAMPDPYEIRELIGVSQLNSTPCQYLLNTSASRTVIHEPVLSTGGRKNVQPSTLRVMVAENTDCFVVGILAVNIEFGNHVLSEEVLVVKELTHDCLLGMDVLMKHPVTREVMCHLETVVKIRLSNPPPITLLINVLEKLIFV